MKNNNKPIFITGGHYTPAKAVMDELLSTNNWKIYYVGLKHSFEGDMGLAFEYLELKDKKEVAFLKITTGRLQRKFTSHTITSLLKIPVGFIQSFLWLIFYSPKIVLSFGGFVALPVVISAWILDIPVVTHEQTMSFGLANRIIQLFAKKVLVSFESTLPNKADEKWIYTGNPLRSEIFTINKSSELEVLKNLKKKLKLPVVFFTGGKHGSHVINKEVVSGLTSLVKKSLLIIQTGDNREFSDFDAFQGEINKLSSETRERVLVSKFFSSRLMGSVYSLADLVVGRAGANTVFDLAALGKPAVLIPIPWSSGSEQEKNALELSKFGGCVVLDQNKIDNLTNTVFDVLGKINFYKQKATLAKKMVNLNSATIIAKIIESEIE